MRGKFWKEYGSKIMSLFIVIMMITVVYPVLVDTAKNPSQLSVYDDDWNDISEFSNELSAEKHEIKTIDSSPAIMDKITEIEKNSTKQTIKINETIKQLFRVASGMESMMLGENQILSQVKTAHEHLLISSGKTPLLNQLFRDAVSCGKAVRTDTNLCRGAVSISLAAVELAKRIYSSFQKQKILNL